MWVSDTINRREIVLVNYEDDDDEEEKSKYSPSGPVDSAHSTGEGWVVVGDPAHQGGTYMNFLWWFGFVFLILLAPKVLLEDL